MKGISLKAAKDMIRQLQEYQASKAKPKDPPRPAKPDAA